jgi:dihydrofolate reductase
MPTVFAFIVTTLDGYDEGPKAEFDWPNVDDEFLEFSVQQLRDIGVLVFGRRTYEGMAEYWPTPMAQESTPAVADLMNSLPKVVFSTTLTSADWTNSTLARGDIADTIDDLKAKNDKDIAVFGSAHLTAAMLERGLIDELRVMVHPILLGAGRSLLGSLSGRVKLELLRTTVFHSGNVLLTYRPAAERAES